MDVLTFEIVVVVVATAIAGAGMLCASLMLTLSGIVVLAARSGVAFQRGLSPGNRRVLPSQLVQGSG